MEFIELLWFWLNANEKRVASVVGLGIPATLLFVAYCLAKIKK